MEAEERPKAFEELGKQIQLYMKIIEAYKSKVACLTQFTCTDAFWVQQLSLT